MDIGGRKLYSTTFLKLARLYLYVYTMVTLVRSIPIEELTDYKNYVLTLFSRIIIFMA